MIHLPETHRILIVDDEPDVHAITEFSLRGMRFRGRPVEFATALTGEAAIEAMRARPDTSLILLDVVMETPTAGLDACRAIREELDNQLVRILLRTGQPGIAPERRAIEEYDIDNYLPKTELTTNRLYAAVRTALKAFEELVTLERHRRILAFLHDSVVVLRDFEPLEVSLQRILATATSIAPSPLAVLDLHTFDADNELHRVLLHLSADPDPARAQAAAESVAARVAAEPTAAALQTGGPFGEGFLVPVTLHRDLGYGWFYLEGATPDELATEALCLLAAHASNALYANVAQAMLAAREGPLFESLAV
jgi:CheY-like chemotaxis protein